jgi:uncharacterized membrane protein YqjE
MQSTPNHQINRVSILAGKSKHKMTEIERRHERDKLLHGTIRWGLTSFFVVAGLWVTLHYLTAILKSDEPWWMRLTVLLVGLLIGSSPTAWGLKMVYDKLTIHIKRDAAQKSEIQAIVDAKRMSSGVGQDGHHEND